MMISHSIACMNNDELKAMYIAWMCTAPQNNPWLGMAVG